MGVMVAGGRKPRINESVPISIDLNRNVVLGVDRLRLGGYSWIAKKRTHTRYYCRAQHWDAIEKADTCFKHIRTWTFLW